MIESTLHYGEVTTFRILLKQDQNRLQSSLTQSARHKKTILVIPLLASEFTALENRPVFENILSQLSQVPYIYQIIFGLDQASEDDALLLRDILKQYKVNNYIIQWNDGPIFSQIYKVLNDAGFVFLEPGKGKNIFLSFGIALALGAKVVGVLDADIRSFERDQINSLFYPVVVNDYDFSKAYYERISGDRLYGRVKRLLLDPLLLALRKKISEPKYYKILGVIDFLMKFNYQLSGEVAFNSDVLKKMHFATNWGAEIFTLIEIYHKATSAAQVMFSQKPFDHKHQEVSESDETKGLNRMAIDIVATLINVLVEDGGLEVSDDFFRDLALVYSKIGEQRIKMYSEEAAFNNLSYDHDEEERLIRNVFRNCILRAGEILTTQSMITGRFMRVIHTYPEFKPHLDAGLSDTIISVEKKIKRDFFETPQTVSWDRITKKLPNIFEDLNKAIRQEKNLLS